MLGKSREGFPLLCSALSHELLLEIGPDNNALRGGTTDTIRWSNVVGSRASARQHEPGTNPPTVTPLSTDMLEFIALLQTTSKKISPFCHHKSVVTSLTQWTRV